MHQSLKEESSPEVLLSQLQLGQIIKGAIQANKSFAFWKKQGAIELEGVISLSDTINYDKSDLESAPPGFLVSPFKNDTRHKDIRIDADIVFKQQPDDQSFFVAACPQLNAEIESLHEKIESAALSPGAIAPYLPLSASTDVTGYTDRYKSVVHKAVEEIKDGRLIKVVPSRYIEVPYPEGWDFISAFGEMCQSYQGAFVYIFGIPGIGTWMGATPELLLSVVNNRWFKSVALAGTQKIPESGDLSQVAWTQKEIEEQALVSRYIINCFKKIRVREYDEKGPKTSKAGNLAHLKTEYYVDMEAVNFPQLGTVMLELLHPTSAVCGMPLEPALAFIDHYEGYEREYFSGYLGPVNMDGITQLYVNLRSMKLMADKARLYAGAGVTEDSVPEKEWEETELKFQTMKRLFEKE